MIDDLHMPHDLPNDELRQEIDAIIAGYTPLLHALSHSTHEIKPDLSGFLWSGVCTEENEKERAIESVAKDLEQTLAGAICSSSGAITLDAGGKSDYWKMSQILILDPGKGISLGVPPLTYKGWRITDHPLAWSRANKYLTLLGRRRGLCS